MKEYIDSLTDPDKITTGDPSLLPKDLYEKYGAWESLEETFNAERWHLAPEDEKASIEAITKARTEYLSDLKEAVETYHEQQNSMPRSPVADYLESISVDSDIFSGNLELLPKSLQERFKNLIQLENDFFYDHPNEKSPHQEAFKNELDKFDSDWQRQNEDSKKMEIENNPKDGIGESDSMRNYIESLSKPGDFLSGNPNLLPEDLKEKHLQFASLEESYFSGERFNHENDRAPYTEALNDARKEYYKSLISNTSVIF